MFKSTLDLISFLANLVLKKGMNQISRSEYVTYLFPMTVRYSRDAINMFNEYNLGLGYKHFNKYRNVTSLSSNQSLLFSGIHDNMSVEN